MADQPGVLFAVVANDGARNQVAVYDLRTREQKVLLTGGRIRYSSSPATLCSASAMPFAPWGGVDVRRGAPVTLFDARACLVLGTTLRPWDVAPDGRFLMVQDDGLVAPMPLLVVLNWIEELKATFTP